MGKTARAQAALDLIGRGLAVVPLKQMGKVPVTAHGLKDWTDNPEQVEAWWGFGRHARNAPDYNVGVVCGAPSGGLIVIDVDTHGADGLKNLREFETVNGKLPETVEVVTGSNGRHYYYRTTRELHPFANPELGIDLRAEGSYVVAPPSVHPNGTPYEFAASFDDCDIAPANDIVYRLIDWATPARREEAEGERFRLPETIGEGGRNDTLFRYACSLRSIHRGRDEIFNALAGVNATRCAKPLGVEELRRIADSAMTYDEMDEGPREEGPRVGDNGLTVPPRNKRGGVAHNVLADIILEEDHACYIDGALNVWDGRRWTADTRAIDMRSRLRVPDAKTALIREVYEYLRDMAPERYSEDFSGSYIQFRNLTLDLDTMEPVEPTPDMLVTGALDVDWVPDAGEGAADYFLDDLSVGDASIRKVLQQVLCVAMLPRKPVKKAVMLVGRADAADGNSSNGKSSFTYLVEQLVGRENHCNLSLQQLGGEFMTSLLFNKLVNIGDDIPATFVDTDALSTFKKVVTGETVVANIKGKTPMTFTPSALHIFSMNTIPHLADVGGLERRLMFVPFRAKFTPDGLDIKQFIATEDFKRRAAVLALGEYEGLRAARAYATTDAIERELAEVMRDNSPVARWMDDAGLGARWLDGRTTAEVYEQYRGWALTAGERNPLSKPVFGKQLRARAFVDGDGGERLRIELVKGAKGMRLYRCVPC